MHMHVPKPVHGWKQFFNEIIVIAIGILIALGLEQALESLRWQAKANEGTVLLQHEGKRNFLALAELVAVTPCINTQLDSLRPRLLSSGSSPAPTFILGDHRGPVVIQYPARPYLDGAWVALNNDGTSTHMDTARFAEFSGVYVSLTVLRTQHLASIQAVSRLYVLSEPLAFDVATRGQLLTLIAEQKGRIDYQSLLSLNILRYLRHLGEEPSAVEISTFMAKSATIKFCKAHGYPLADWRNVLSKYEQAVPRSY